VEPRVLTRFPGVDEDLARSIISFASEYVREVEAARAEAAERDSEDNIRTGLASGEDAPADSEGRAESAGDESSAGQEQQEPQQS